VPYVRENVLRTAILLTVLCCLILAIGALAGGENGLLVAVALAVVVCAVAYFGSDRIALAVMRSRPVSEWEYPQLYRLVRELSTTARTPVPRIYMSSAIQPNAFATGRNRRHAAICCTEGILQILDPAELRAVLGHELSHIQSRDILVSTVAAGTATVITFLSVFAWLLPFGRGAERLFKLLFMMVLGPLAAFLIHLSVTRAREYQADTAGSLLTGDPLALARALRKIELGTVAHPLRASGQLAAAGHLMIVGPFRTTGLGRLFTTHPPVAERVRRLESLAGLPR
jgi:heat shock protein HtpX